MVDWLLDSDPAHVWQAERAKVATGGWGARLLAHQDADGQWAGGAFLPRDFTAEEWRSVGQPWTATSWTLTQLREFGLDPETEQIRRGVALIGENARWDQPVRCSAEHSRP